MRIRTVAVGPLLATALIGCGSDPTAPGAVDPAAVVGNWAATEALAINPANPAETVELVALGFDISLMFEADGGARASIGTESDTGSYTIDGNAIVLILSGERSSGSVALEGERLIVTLTEGVVFDFRGNGIDIPATLRLTMRRMP